MNSRIQSHEPSEDVWIGQAIQGDLDAFNQLVLLYQNLAYNHAYAMLGDPALSDDAAQEGFIKAFQNISSFRGGSFRAWLLRIVTNAAYDVLRQSRRHPVQPLLPEDEEGEENESPAWIADPATSVQGTVEQNEEARRIYQILDELPALHRSVITLIDLYELDYEEAARALKVPIGTVKSRLARARLQMQKKLQSSLGDSQSFGATEATAVV